MVLTVKNNSSLKEFVTVIFSKDRPMQLDLTLSTYEKYSCQRNIGNEFVIYKASDAIFENSYQQVKKEHPNIIFKKETTFKLDLYECLKNKKYVLFIVDDCIFTRKFSIKYISSMLDICSGALGFSLRLGKNTTYCYSLNVQNDIPSMQPLGGGVLGFCWKESEIGDFAYPLEVSSSVYRIENIKPFLEGLHYYNPNSLEWMISNTTKFFNNLSFLLCYETSVAFCDPINRVQTENNNRAGVDPKYSVQNLLTLYEAGYRIDNSLFDGFTSSACHQEVDIDFIKPNTSENEYR